MTKSFFIGGLFCTAFLGLTLPGCNGEGPAERTGRVLDEAAQDAAQLLEAQQQQAAERLMSYPENRQDCLTSEGGC